MILPQASTQRKLTYSTEGRRIALIRSLGQKRGFRPKLGLCNGLNLTPIIRLPVLSFERTTHRTTHRFTSPKNFFPYGKREKNENCLR